ncbi:SpoIIE family protein phosphatase [Streptomyces minutiscleroticus]|uniref:SpoIIE family protein phosphatase n=1 Tax=Streptomyces minutiscleroticus TaxID=68238 RepID=UPI0033222C05
MTSESVSPRSPGTDPGVVALARVVARQRTEIERLLGSAADAAALERAKGVVMVQEGCTAEAAHEELARRAEAGRRTLVEQCRATLGEVSPSPHDAAPPPTVPVQGGPAAGPDGAPAPAEREAAAGGLRPGDEGGGDAGARLLGRIGEALAGVGTPAGLADLLLTRLAEAAGIDAVLVHGAGPGEDPHLIARAGAEAPLSGSGRTPPPDGTGALRAVRTGEPVWVEGAAPKAEGGPPLDGPRERWPSRAWLPVVTGGTVTAALGVLRTRGGPFTPAERDLLTAVARLCAGPLRRLAASCAHEAAHRVRTVQSVLDALPESAVLLTPVRTPSGEVADYRIDAAAPRSVDVAGRRGRELVGLRLLECYPTIAGEPAWRGFLHTLTTGEPYESGPFRYREVLAGVPETSTFSVRAARLGDALVVTWVRHDPLDRREQRLADLQRLGNLGWADWNLFTGEANWSPQIFTIFGRSPFAAPLTLEEISSQVLPEDLPSFSAAHAGLLRGRPMDTSFRIRTDDDVRYLRAVAEAVADADGTAVEVHGFVQDLTAERSAELALVESERAMLTQQGALRAERALGARLQDALLPLPAKPMELAGLRVDVAYRPAQAGIHVGGDWFSAIELPDGSALFVVGDVAGHGVGAVATMAQLRFTAKGMIITGSSLTGALVRLNTLLLHTHTNSATSTATMVLVRYEPWSRRLVWAQAGHPPPLLVRDGRSRFLERPRGVLLGATLDPVFEEAEYRLGPGDHLLLYTDGLVERPSDGIGPGLDRLREAAAGMEEGDPAPLGPLLEAMLQDERRDDVCVLDVHLPPDAGPLPGPADDRPAAGTGPDRAAADAGSAQEGG